MSKETDKGLHRFTVHYGSVRVDITGWKALAVAAIAVLAYAVVAVVTA